MHRPLPILFAALLLLAAIMPRAGADAPGAAPFFTPVPSELRGYLARPPLEQRKAPDSRTVELVGLLQRLEGLADPAGWKEALQHWEAITGRADAPRSAGAGRLHRLSRRQRCSAASDRRVPVR